MADPAGRDDGFVAMVVDFARTVRADGVDLLNTDKLSDLRQFLLEEEGHGSK